MNRTLETCINEMRGLADTDQARFGQVLIEMLSEIHHAGEFRVAMTNTDYRAYVEQSLAKGQADIKAGRVHSLDEIKQRSTDRLNKLHG